MITVESIRARIDEYWQDQAEKSNRQLSRKMGGNRASQMGGCARKIYYMRVEPDESLPWYNPELLMIFNDGHGHEKMLEEDFEKMGYQVRKQQAIIDNHPDFKEVNITGSSDWTLIDGDEEQLVECKSMNRHDFGTIEKWQDFNRSYYMKKYPAQAQLYAHGLNRESVIFLLKNKESGIVKVIPMERDQKFVKLLIDKANLVNNRVKLGVPPDRIGWCKECEKCSFVQHCLPDIKMEGRNIEIKEPDKAVIDMLDELQELKESYARYGLLDELKKAYFKNLIGERDEIELRFPGYRIKVKKSTRKAFSVAAGITIRSIIEKLEVNNG